MKLTLDQTAMLNGLKCSSTGLTRSEMDRLAADHNIPNWEQVFQELVRANLARIDINPHERYKAMNLAWQI